jgi:FAD/FMN-containing dehydrogenase
MSENYHSASPEVALPALSIPQLRAEFNGPVITPEDEEYHRARTVFYGGIDRRPAVILQAVDTADVARAVALARETGMELAIRSGGHSLAGHSVSNGGIVLDLRKMKAMKIDPKSRTVWAETGLTAGEFTVSAGAYGLATGFGDTGSVGIGGITLGGGVGFLVRKYGLTIDHLLAAELVTADGQTLHVDAETHPDLFWAIRGGGGNFGVATRFQFQLHQVDVILGGMLILPATAEVISSFIAEAEAAPDELSAVVNIMPAPPMPFLPAEIHGQLVVMAMMVYTGPIEAGERAVAPFRRLATPIADTLRPMHYPEMYPAEMSDDHPAAASTTMFIDWVDRDVAKTMLDYLKASDAAVRVAQLRVLGGAMARVPVSATAFAHRHSRIMTNLFTLYNNPEDRSARETWISEFAAALRQRDSGAYVNFMNDEGNARIRSAYPGIIWNRLTAIKMRYDPENLFRLNQNIPPR